MAESTAPTPQAHPFDFHGVKIDVLLQDVITIRADAVVNSAGTMEPIDMSRGLSSALRQAGGKFSVRRTVNEVVKYDLQKHGPGPLPSGSVVVTTAGLLPQVKYLFHAIIIVWGRKPLVTEDDVRSATAECIRLANALRLRSIALPALGTGESGRADENRIAPAIVDTLFRCLEEKTTLEEVHFFGKQPATIDTFFQAILAARDATPTMKAFAQVSQRHLRRNVLLDLKHQPDGSYAVVLDTKTGLAIELNRSAVVNLNKTCIEALHSIGRAARQAYSSKPEKPEKLEDDVLERLADNLRTAGQQVFNETFKPGSQIRKDVERVLSEAQTKRRLSAWEARSSAVDDFPLIWEMLYNARGAEPASVNKFGTELLWGIQFAIARQITGTVSGIFDPYITDPEKGGGMLLLVDDSLTSAKALEAPGLIELAKARGIPCRRIDSLLTKTSPALKDILDALADDAAGYDFVHFACHVKPADDATKTKLIITVNGVKVAVTLGDLVGHGLLWEKSHPLVFLNACESVTPTGFDSRTLVKYFLDRGARGVIATQCLMPDVFAAGFALKFYEHFFRGLPIDQALLEARRECLKEDNNPLGLAYTVYANPSTQIEWAATS